MFRKTWSTALLSAALFCAGAACGWLVRGDDRGTGDVSVPPDKAVDVRPAPIAQDVSSHDEGNVAEPQFAEAISADDFRRRQRPAEATRELESGARRQ